MINYDQYYKKGGTYVIPVEIFNDLLGELEELHNKTDKAIKYLETNGYGYDCCGDMCYFLDEHNQKDLLKILKDSDVDE